MEIYGKCLKYNVKITKILNFKENYAQKLLIDRNLYIQRVEMCGKKDTYSNEKIYLEMYEHWKRRAYM